MKEFNLLFLVPVVMLFFIAKSAVLPYLALPLSVLTAFMFLTHFLFLEINSKKISLLTKSIVLVGLFICFSLGLFFKDKVQDGVMRPMNLEQAELIRANLTERFMEKANLQEANLKEAKLWRTNLRESKLQYANLSNAQLWRADLRSANLEGAKLKEAFLRQADLSHASMNLANLQCANLVDANLNRAEIKRGFLRNANLRGANLKEANLHEANLRGAKLQGADLSTCKGLTQVMLEKALGDHLTKLPSHLKRPKAWRKNQEDDDEPPNS